MSRGAERFRQPRQELIARLAAGDLDPHPALGGQGRHVGAFDGAVHAQPRGLRRDEPRVLVRRRAAHAVMQMSHVQREPRMAPVPDLAHQVEQRQRVRPAGDRQDHAAALGQQVMPPDRRLEFRDDVLHARYYSRWTRAGNCPAQRGLLQSPAAGKGAVRAKDFLPHYGTGDRRRGEGAVRAGHAAGPEEIRADRRMPLRPRVDLRSAQGEGDRGHPD